MSKFSFLNNNWIVTLTATLIGVFAALYLNEIVASRKLNQQKVIATKNIFQEIKQNRESLEVSIKKLEIMLGTIVFMNERMQENGEFISSVDSLAIFKEKYSRYMIQVLSIISVGIIGVIGVFYKIIYAKDQRVHLRKLKKMEDKLNIQNMKMQYRMKQLNVYNFLKYNLKEALGN